MAKKNNLFAQIIAQAKERLKEGNYTDTTLKQRVKRKLILEENKIKNQETSIKKPHVSFSVYNIEEKQRDLKQKIEDSLKDGQIHMMSEFINQDEFDRLDDINKQKYILEFAEAYNRIREDCFKRMTA